MAAVVTPVIVEVTDLLEFLFQEAPVIQELYSARNAGVEQEALVAAIRQTTLSLSDQEMRDELKPPGGG
jgi:hypothetical protein